MLTRTIDILAALGGLLLLSPLFALVAFAIRLDSSGPVFYRAQRVGKDGRLFLLYKFRTMRVGADRHGPGITTAEDRRITPVGRLLRKTKFDELPQLIDVLRGEMSLVGPRPEDPRYAKYYTPEQSAMLRVRPGITSPASLFYRDEASLLIGEHWERTHIERILPHKLAIELDHLAHRNVLTDLCLIARTLWAVVSRS